MDRLNLNSCKNHKNVMKHLYFKSLQIETKETKIEIIIKQRQNPKTLCVIMKHCEIKIDQDCK